jgi:hypothetical protein
MSTLYQWKIYETDGYLFCTGMFRGRRWETSEVVSLETYETYYLVRTLNSTYRLYYDSRRY